MKDYQKEFIEFSLNSEVLKFGDFILKSGRKSPYFFNAGMWCDGLSFLKLGCFYAKTIMDHFSNQYDLLFGPAYKGISLATATSIGLMTEYSQNIPVSFNRKEIKDHGEGGSIIGTSIKGKRILLVDDVITAGITIRDSLQLINSQGGKLIGIVIALDREECGIDSKLSAIQEIEVTHEIKVRSIITLSHLIEYLSKYPLTGSNVFLKKISAYRIQYGVVNSHIVNM